jgi:hypothetical protein
MQEVDDDEVDAFDRNDLTAPDVIGLDLSHGGFSSVVCVAEISIATAFRACLCPIPKRQAVAWPGAGSPVEEKNDNRRGRISPVPTALDPGCVRTSVNARHSLRFLQEFGLSDRCRKDENRYDSS